GARTVGGVGMGFGPSSPWGGPPWGGVARGGAQGCWLDPFSISLGGTCPPAASAFVEVLPSSVAVVGGNGDADGHPDNCETTTVSYTVRNVGGAPSGPIASTVTSTHPGVTFSPDPLSQLPSFHPSP